MSWKVANLCDERKFGSPVRKQIIMFLADKASDDGSGIWCSKGTVHRHTELGESTVKRTIGNFLDEGLLVETGRRPCKNGFTVIYCINLRVVADLEKISEPDDDPNPETGPTGDGELGGPGTGSALGGVRGPERTPNHPKTIHKPPTRTSVAAEEIENSKAEKILDAYPKDRIRDRPTCLALILAVTYGGCAVFHARIDRDEKGRHGVDVFFAPRYEKHTASKGTEQWISLSKFSKENARTRYGKRQKEVKKRNKFVPVYDDNGKPVMVWNDADVFQGRALQDAWFEHLKEHVGDRYEVERGERKKGRDPDRLSPEDYAIEQEGRKLRAEVERQLDSEDLEVDVDNPHQDAAAKLIERASDRALAKAQASSEHIIDAAHDTVDQMIVRAHESAVTDVKAIRAAMLGEGDKEFLKMKEELATLRTEVIRQGKILKIWNEVIKRVLPKNMRELLKSAFDATWKKHDDEVVRSEPVPERNVAFRP